MLLVGSCSAIKRHPAHPLLRASQVKARTLRAFAAGWRDRITSVEPTTPARDLYAGAGTAALRSAADTADARLLFVSAGMGVVRGTERIASYDLTVSRQGPGPFSLLKVPYRPVEWWAEVHPERKSPLSDYIRGADGHVTIALPATYLEMVSEDLSRLSPSQASRLRIIITAGAKVSGELREQCIAYDSRLNSLGAPYSGSMSSLVQRAALHFVLEVASDGRLKSIDAQRTRVERLLAEQPYVERAERRAQTDAQIARLLASMVRRHLAPTTALTELRSRGIACESSRFRRIYDELRDGH